MKISMKQTRKEYESIEEEFFDLDHGEKTALVRLEYETPEEIFDENADTKTPMMSEEFIERLGAAFDKVPDRYGLNIRVAFDDLNGYTEEDLATICRKNILQETRTRVRLAHRQNLLALALCGVGLAFILLSIWVGSAWQTESLAKEVVVYILDIVATVPFWGAMEIYIIENREKRRRITNITRRFHTIEFVRKNS